MILKTTREEFNKLVERAIDSATYKFWQEVSAYFPGASEDLGVLETDRFNDVADDMVKAWVRRNIQLQEPRILSFSEFIGARRFDPAFKTEAHLDVPMPAFVYPHEYYIYVRESDGKFCTEICNMGYESLVLGDIEAELYHYYAENSK